MRVTGVDHLVLTVTDAERSVAWYRDILGLEPLRLDEWRRGEVLFASLRVNDTTIIDVLQGERSGTNVDHVAFVVEPCDLEAWCSDRGLEIEMGPLELFGARGQGYGVYTRDPDGNRVEVRHYGGGVSG
jgi:catechol 2,3-dioxygenase-like lactoylglutathione lyase family enzyme